MKIALGALLATILIASTVPAAAQGILYRSAATGRWVEVATRISELPTSGSSISEAILDKAEAKAAFSMAHKPAGGCDAAEASLVAFSTKTKSPSSSAILLHDAISGSMIEVAVEGEQVPGQGAGVVWDDFDKTSVGVAVDLAACEIHVVFPARMDGHSSAIDSAIFDQTIDFPTFTLGSLDQIVREGFTPAPTPFDPSALFSDINEETRIAIAQDPVSGYVLAFPAVLRNAGGGPFLIDNDNATALMRYESSGSSLTTVIRAGDPTCAPGWPGAGPMYDDVIEKLLPAVGVGATPTVMYSIRSSGGSDDTNTAVEQHRGSGCGSSGTVATVAAEGGPTPLFGGSQWSDLSFVSVAYDAVGGSVMSGEIGGALEVIATGPPFGAASTAIIEDTISFTSLSDEFRAAVKIQRGDRSNSLAINSAGDVLFVLEKVKPYSLLGLYYYNAATAPEPELVIFKKSIRSKFAIDGAGNIAAAFK